MPKRKKTDEEKIEKLEKRLRRLIRKRRKSDDSDGDGSGAARAPTPSLTNLLNHEFLEENEFNEEGLVEGKCYLQ